MLQICTPCHSYIYYARGVPGASLTNALHLQEAVTPACCSEHGTVPSTKPSSVHQFSTPLDRAAET